MFRYVGTSFIIVCVLALSCGPAPAFTAECGLVVEDSEFIASRSDIVACQHAAVKHGLTTCDLMQGVHLQFMSTRAWIDVYDRHVNGVTWCAGMLSAFDTFPTIQVGNGVEHPAYEGALIHELHHLGECAAHDWDIGDHDRWKDDGIYDAITAAKADAHKEYASTPGP